MALHSRLVLPDAALRLHCRLLLPDAVVEASVQRQLLPDAAVRLLCQQHLPDAALRLLCQQRPAQRRPSQQHIPDGAPPRCPRQQQLPYGLRHGAPASNISADTAPPACNKPHSAERSTPVWLAIWRTWAGFANSQLRRAAFRCTYSYICTHPRYCRLELLLRQSKSFGPSAPIAYATSVSPPNEAVAWPGCRCWVLDMAVAWAGVKVLMANDVVGCPCRSSCKSPRARILVLGTSGAH